MAEKTVWLFFFVALYWSYCIFWGIKGARQARTATDYFLAGRSISLWVFVLAATATSFSGWTFMGHPGLIYRDGFQYAYASFYTITIPFTGVMFLKRQWMIGKRFGFVTPGEMLGNYFGSKHAIPILVVIVAMIFSVPYLGLQLRASGFLFNALTGLDIDVGMWMLSAVVLIYVASGGLRAVAYVDTMQCVLLAGGIIVVGIIAYSYFPLGVSWNQAIGTLAAADDIRTPEGFSHYVAIPGVIQFVKSGIEAEGGAWTGIMILTYMFALMGIQSAPAFSMWAFGNNSPAPFAPQQVWASSAGIGLILFVFTAMQGIGAHFLGADLQFAIAHPEVVNPVLQGAGFLNGVDLLNSAGRQEMLVPQLINLMGDSAPWLVGLLSVCALAAMQSTGAAYMSTAGGMLTRDILKPYIMPKASHVAQKLWGRIGVAIIVLLALVVATKATDALVLLGGLAVAFGFQMWPALIGICYWPYLTRIGITVGLVLGLIAVMCTESIGVAWFGIEAWGRWPLTIHSAGWGILFNLGSAIVISAFTQSQEEMDRKMQFHNFLKEHASMRPERRKLVPLGIVVTLVWFFFAIGPGAVVGNTLFGHPNNPESWLFGIPSIWTWQLIWWIVGVFMMWLLAYRLEMSTVPSTEIRALREDIGDLHLDVNSPGGA